MIHRSPKVVPNAMGGATRKIRLSGRCIGFGMIKITRSVDSLPTRSKTAIIKSQGMLLKATTETPGKAPCR
jgi:hypothetical protein